MKIINNVFTISILALTAGFALGEVKTHQLCQIILQGQTVYSSEKLIKLARWNATDTFSDAAIEAGIDRILETYEDSGYP